MASSREYEHKIKQYSTHADLLHLWQAVEADNTAAFGWDPGKAFEYLIVRAFELEGAEVRYPYIVQMEQNGKQHTIEEIDGVIYSEGIACLLQTKKLAENVNIDPIAKLRRQVDLRPRDVVGAVFSFKGFTEPAVINLRHESPQVIMLWNGYDVKYSLMHYDSSQRGMRWGLRRKYQYLVEFKQPDIDLEILS